jgi:hypothetical protein
MPTTLLTDHERTAVRAYLRLLHTVRATLDDPSDVVSPPVVPPGVLAEAELALSRAGLTGNEPEFFRLLAAWCTEP